MNHFNSIYKSVLILIGVLVFNIKGYAMTSQDMICTDITAIDFKNYRIDIANRGAVLLENGKGFSSDAGEYGKSKDWEITLVHDEILHPTPSDFLRLIKLNSNHKTGTGGIWDHVYIFKCDGGKLTKVLQDDYLFGVKIQKATDAELHFISLELMKEDAMCCPSQQKYSIYKWADEKGMFELYSCVLRQVIKK